jgi:hypothetical protein
MVAYQRPSRGVGRKRLPSGTDTKVSSTPSSNRLLPAFSGLIVPRAIDKSEVISNVRGLAMVASDSNKNQEGFMATTSVAVATMKAAQVTAAGAGLKIVELEIPDPGPGQVRIKVQACGVCHSDAIILEGLRPGIPLSARSRA